MEPGCPKEEDPGSQGQTAKLTEYRDNPNERWRACVYIPRHGSTKSSIFLSATAMGSRIATRNLAFGAAAAVPRNCPLQPRQGGGATGRPCPDLRRRGPVTPGRRRGPNGKAYLRVPARWRRGVGAEAEQRAESSRGSLARSEHDGDCTE